MSDFKREDILIKATFTSSYIFLGIGGIFGLLQALSRAPGFPRLLTPDLYYISITLHGIVMVVPWITFFIFGLTFYILTRHLDLNLHSVKTAWAAFLASLIGVLTTASVIIAGEASVGWTFYAPLYANPLFYLGLVIFIVGTWIFTFEVFLTIRNWRKNNKERRLPLSVHGISATLIMWVISTIPIAYEEIFLRIPWAIDPSRGIDVLLSRTLFWWFGHPVVYFWILPAVVVWYVFYPKIMDGELYSDYFGRMVFMLFIIFSIPVGVHHQFADPGFSTLTKYVFTILTYFVGIPSLMTAFNVAATMERAGRREGGRGLLFGWIKKLPWKDPAFTAISLALLNFAIGGITGFINAGYHLNLVVHNTVWVVGHFHQTAAGGATLTYMGISYYIIPKLFKKELWNKKLALIQSGLWFFGLVTFSSSTAVAGVLGSPRRTYDITYFGAEQAKSWIPYIQVSAIGGILMFIGLALFIAIMFFTGTSKKTETFIDEIKEEKTVEKSKSIWDNFMLFGAIAFLLALSVYIPTLVHLDQVGAPKVMGARPSGPFAGETVENIEMPGEASEEVAEDIVLGAKLYRSKGCSACHTINGRPGTGPTLQGVYGRKVLLESGENLTADDNYLQESILYPDAKIVAGYSSGIMSSVIGQGNIKEEEAEALVAYMKTL